MLRELNLTMVKLRKSKEVNHRIIQKLITNELDKEIPKERYISSEKRQKIFNELAFNIIV